MIKSSFLVSVILAAAAPACHHDHPPATPATAEPASTGGMTATAEPGHPAPQGNSYDSNSDRGATSPGATVPGDPQLPQTNDPDRTGSPGTPSGSGAPTDTGTDMGNAPDTTTPTSAKDAGSGSNTTRRSTGKSTTSGKPRSGSNSGSNGSGSADGSGGSGSDVPR